MQKGFYKYGQVEMERSSRNSFSKVSFLPRNTRMSTRRVVSGLGFIPPEAGQRGNERNVAPLLRSERCEK
jgi:hypothetical protein